MFLSGDKASAQVVVFVAGLTNTLLSVPYVAPLSEALEREGWGLCQLLTSSSGYGFAHGSLDRDVREISGALGELRKLGWVWIVLRGVHSSSRSPQQGKDSAYGPQHRLAGCGALPYRRRTA